MCFLSIIVVLDYSCVTNCSN